MSDRYTPQTTPPAPGTDLRAEEADGLRFPGGVGDERILTSDDVVTLAEERAYVTKRRYQSGLVRVRTVTEEAEHVERADLEFETAEVTHHPVNQFVDTMPRMREEGDVTVLPVVEERLVVEKRLFVTEEIHIRRVRRTEEVELPVSLRRQHAVVERLDPEGESRDEPIGAAAQSDPNQ